MLSCCCEIVEENIIRVNPGCRVHGNSNLEVVTEITALKSLVREMGDMLNEWAYANESFGGVVIRFKKTQDILARTEVKAIMEGNRSHGYVRIQDLRWALKEYPPGQSQPWEDIAPMREAKNRLKAIVEGEK